MKLWGGRFAEPMDERVRRFTSSLAVDRRLYRQDIRASIAHVTMLGKCQILSTDEAKRIAAGLEDILKDIANGQLSFDTEDEDIHSFVERNLIERIGAVGGKLHTARSRNDQVATDLRLFVREQIDQFTNEIAALQSVFADLAEKHLDNPMPGYTHLQRAQPVLLSHHLLAYFWMLQRDRERLIDCRARVNVLPLGSAALAGATFPIAREFVAKELGFDGVSENSMDAVSDRDFAAEYVFALGLLLVHLSRLCEELVLWSSSEFGFVELEDRFATGSSIMPQKKNPDVAELIRGRSSRVIGELTTLLTLMKGLPLTYNRDLQEDKAAVFQATDIAADAIGILPEVLKALRFRTDRMRESALEGFALATDLADSLARGGVPFREAHEVVGKVVRECLRGGKALQSLTLQELQRMDPRFNEESQNALNLDTALRSRSAGGGTAPDAVRKQLAKARQLLVQE